MNRRQVLIAVLTAPLAAHAADTVEVDLTAIAPGAILAVRWGSRTVFVRHRTAAEIEAARAVPLSDLPHPEKDRDRVERAEWLVVLAECTHGGCEPTGPLGRFGGWYCLCHGSQFDTSGRVRIGPARTNLVVVPHRFVGDDRLIIGSSTS